MPKIHVNLKEFSIKYLIEISVVSNKRACFILLGLLLADNLDVME
jgi:hypothetical protein